MPNMEVVIEECRYQGGLPCDYLVVLLVSILEYTSPNLDTAAQLHNT